MEGYELFYHFTREDCGQSGTGIYLTRPTIIGLVETDGNEIKRPERIQYFHLPESDNYPLDLNRGFENYKFRTNDFSKIKLGKVSFFIKDKDLFNKIPEDIENVETRLNRCEVITNRVTLGELMQAPYKFGPNNYSRNKLRILATYFKRKLFLVRDDDDREFDRSMNATHHIKFKQYCFSDDPDTEPDPTAPIDESKQIYGMFKSKIKNIDLMYSGILCGIQSSTKLRDLNDEAEVGQCRLVNTKVMYDSFPNWMNNYRTSILWINAYLMGVNDIFVAFKTNEGIVSKPVRHLLAQQIPINQKWSPKAYNRFLYNFIIKVMEKMQDIDCPHTCCEFIFCPEKACIEFKIHHGPSDLSFLDDAFIEYLRKIKNFE